MATKMVIYKAPSGKSPRYRAFSYVGKRSAKPSFTGSSLIVTPMLQQTRLFKVSCIAARVFAASRRPPFSNRIL